MLALSLRFQSDNRNSSTNAFGSTGRVSKREAQSGIGPQGVVAEERFGRRRLMRRGVEHLGSPGMVGGISYVSAEVGNLKA